MQKRPVQISRGTEMVFEVFAILIVLYMYFVQVVIIIQVLYGAHIHLDKDAQGACIIITLAIAPAPLWHSAFEGTYSCWEPIYYTWVERENCG